MSRVILNINTTSGNKNSDNEDKKRKMAEEEII